MRQLPRRGWQNVPFCEDRLRLLPRGWERQLNLISWNDGEPKYDIRDWSPDGTRMGKGISLSGEELAILKGILEDLEL